MQNDVGNKYSPTVIGVPITSKDKPTLPTHIFIKSDESGLSKDSVALVEQIRVLDKSRLIRRVGHLNNEKMGLIKEAIKKNLKLRLKIDFD